MRRNIRRNVKHIKQRSKRNIRRSSKKNVKRSVKRSVKRLSRNKKRSSRRSNRKRIINKKNRTNRRMRGGDDDGTVIPLVVRQDERQWKNSGETAGSYGGNRDSAKMKQETTKASRDNTGGTLLRTITNTDKWYVLDILEDVLKKPVLDPELRGLAEEKLEEQKKICHEWNQAIYYGFYDGWPGGGGLDGWKRVRGTGRRKEEFKHFFPYSEENFEKLHKLVTENNLRASNIDFIVDKYLATRRD